MKVIHIFENLDRGAVENWLVNIFLKSRAIQPNWQWTFFCILPRKGELDEIVRENGGVIIYSNCELSDKFRFFNNLRNVLYNGQYDIIHMHHDFMNAFYIMASIGSRAKLFSHIHNNDEIIPVSNKIIRFVILHLFRFITIIFSNRIIAISKYTLKNFNKYYDKLVSSKSKILYYGIEMERFGRSVDRNIILSRLMLSPDTKILLYVGRINEDKNPLFILEILKLFFSEGNQDVVCLFLGKGEYENTLKSRAEQMGLSSKVRMLGWVNDIVEIMKIADVFLFPRKLEPKEGLGLVVVESQCSGLPMLTTDGIVEDAIIEKDLVEKLPLDNVLLWKTRVEEILKRNSIVDKTKVLNRMKLSKFELGIATTNFIELYKSALRY